MIIRGSPSSDGSFLFRESSRFNPASFGAEQGWGQPARDPRRFRQMWDGPAQEGTDRFVGNPAMSEEGFTPPSGMPSQPIIIVLGGFGPDFPPLPFQD